MYKKILVPVDGSVSSTNALERAAKLAETMGAEVTLFHVMHIPSQVQSYSGKIIGAFSRIKEGLEENANEILEKSKEILTSQKVAFTVKSVWGEPANEIIEEGQQGGYDLIVIGNRGLGEVMGWFLGSVSQRVVRHSKCSVLLIR
jgi:nucleotide-binding universal stress UspA family protein